MRRESRQASPDGRHTTARRAGVAPAAGAAGQGFGALGRKSPAAFSEALLVDGETLSQFVESSLRASVDVVVRAGLGR
jgi:hypothetical protein